MKTKTKPYKHQIEAYNLLYDKEFGALFLEQGTGKSKIAIDIGCNLFLEGKINTVTVIATNGVHRQWADEQIPEHCSVSYNPYVWTLKNSTLHKRMRDNFLLYPDEYNRLK